MVASEVQKPQPHWKAEAHLMLVKMDQNQLDGSWGFQCNDILVGIIFLSILFGTIPTTTHSIPSLTNYFGIPRVCPLKSLTMSPSPSLGDASPPPDLLHDSPQSHPLAASS